MNDRMDEWINEWTNKEMNEWTHKWVSEGMNEPSITSRQGTPRHA